MDKRTHATINNEECHIGDFVVVVDHRSWLPAERIYRVASVKYDADACTLVCVIDSRISNSVTMNSDAVTGILLESEVTHDKGGRFQRAN